MRKPRDAETGDALIAIGRLRPLHKPESGNFPPKLGAAHRPPKAWPTKRPSRTKTGVSRRRPEDVSGVRFVCVPSQVPGGSGGGTGSSFKSGSGAAEACERASPREDTRSPRIDGLDVGASRGHCPLGLRTAQLPTGRPRPSPLSVAATIRLARRREQYDPIPTHDFQPHIGVQVRSAIAGDLGRQPEIENDLSATHVFVRDDRHGRAECVLDPSNTSARAYAAKGRHFGDRTLPPS